jgi:DNA-binding NarL/FixJ family response regulator
VVEAGHGVVSLLRGSRGAVVDMYPDAAITMLEAYWTFDVSDLLPLVAALTLVMHRQGEMVFPFESGRGMAAGIPGARFVPMEGTWLSLVEGENQDVLQFTTTFLEDCPAPGDQSATGQRLAYPDRLSEREVQVLRLIAAGKSNREIAEWLVISPNPVIRYASSIFDKTGVANRAEAATYAVRRGIVE